MEPYKLEQREDGLLVFTINRPDKRNAINYEVMDGLEDALQISNEGVNKALVITGTGDRAFCSGGDLSTFHNLKTEKEAFEMLNKMSKILVELFFHPKPTIALINGIAVGGGCELAAACDYRIASRHVKAGFIQGTLAITTGWGGGTFLSEKLPHANAMKMLMEAELYDAEQLVELGFFQMAIDDELLEGCKRFLEKMLVLEGDVLKAYKLLLLNKWKKSEIEWRVNEEVSNCARLWEGEAHHLQVLKFLERK
ncbi:enoyl-CoA hydratase/isomerase family protein [Bacillus sp. Bva_UNVM-123]|uniref:enoyl-CoA hydratase/isomerase family protein n=1 Tax=Bacillus sp. Bva_UNVM-123 TaxID=2829798 RepID=UPI00391F5B55